MIAFIRSHAAVFAIGGSLVLAGVSGFFVSQALSAGAQAPTVTTTVNVGEGATGPTGPAGPAGPVGPTGTGGAESCPTGSTFGAVRLNHPTGHVVVWVCIANE
jgi:hypothetical protein